jgi:hypothetical protein
MKRVYLHVITSWEDYGEEEVLTYLRIQRNPYKMEPGQISNLSLTENFTNTKKRVKTNEK